MPERSSESRTYLTTCLPGTGGICVRDEMFTMFHVRYRRDDTYPKIRKFIIIKRKSNNILHLGTTACLWVHGARQASPVRPVSVPRTRKYQDPYSEEMKSACSSSAAQWPAISSNVRYMIRTSVRMKEGPDQCPDYDAAGAKWPSLVRKYSSRVYRSCPDEKRK